MNSEGSGTLDGLGSIIDGSGGGFAWELDRRVSVGRDEGEVTGLLTRPCRPHHSSKMSGVGVSEHSGDECCFRGE